jgi:hypothetical protein
LLVLLSMLLLPSAVVRFYHGHVAFLLVDIPLFLGTFSSLSTFYLLAQKELYPSSWRWKLMFIPTLVAAGIGLTITNTRAVLEGLLGMPSPFQRTAKYTTDHRRARQARLRYQRSSGWLPLANFAAGTYFASCTIYLASIGNWTTLPFVALFVAGFYFTAGLLLLQAYEFRWETQIESSPAGRIEPQLRRP